MKNLMLSTVSPINWGTVYGGQLLKWYFIAIVVICIVVLLLGSNKREFAIYVISLGGVAGITILTISICMWVAGDFDNTVPFTGGDILAYLKRPFIYGILISFALTILVAIIVPLYVENLEYLQSMNDRALSVLTNLANIVAALAMLVSMLSIFGTMLSLQSTIDDECPKKLVAEETAEVTNDASTTGDECQKNHVVEETVEVTNDASTTGDEWQKKLVGEVTNGVLKDTTLLFIVLIILANFTLFSTILKERIKSISIQSN